MPEEVKPAVRNRLIAVIFIVSSLVAAAQVVFFTLMPILAADLSGSEGAAGIPSTAGLLFRAIAAYPLGWLMGRAGRRLGLTVGLLIGLAGMVMSAWAVGIGNFWLFTLGAGLAGIARGASDLSRYAAAEVSPIDRRAKVIGWIVFAGTIGAVTGPLLVTPAVTLADKLGLTSQSGPFWVGAIVLALSAVFTFALLRPDPLTISRQMDDHDRLMTGRRADEPSRPLSQLLQSWHVRLGIGAMTIGQLVMVMIMVITPLHMDHAGHGTGAISLVIMAHQLGMFGLSGATGWLIDHFGATTLIINGAALLVIASLLTPAVVSVIGLSVALFLLGLGWNLCFVAGSSLLAVGLAPAESARIQGFSDTWASAASAAGSLSTGLLFAAGDMLLVGAVGLAFSLGLIAAWLHWRDREVVLV
ncbi:MAG: MFS transporter [Candidatus Promineofilum sp.]|nr:MFS transporter [Promineifilum sp.]